MTNHAAFAADDAVTTVALEAQAGRHFSSFPPSRARDFRKAVVRMDLAAAGVTRPGSWLDSTRASSPRPAKPAAGAEHDHWMENHPSALSLFEEVYRTLTAKMESIPGARVEDNKFCLSVHFRCVEEEEWDALGNQVRAVLEDYPDLRLTEGRKVLEIRPSIEWDKGNALEFLLQSLGYAGRSDVFPIYIGDDRTDEDAFEVLRKMGHGIGILVTKFPKETNASYSLREPAEVKEFLRKLVKSKSSGTKG